MPYQMEAIESAVERCTHFLAIGTSGLVWPAAGLLATARTLGARTWVQSLEAPENLHASDRFFQGRASEVVPVLIGELCGLLGLAPAVAAAPVAMPPPPPMTAAQPG